MQFGPNEDLAKYPRDLPRDLALLESAGVDLVWTPTPEIMYPPGFQTWVTVEGLTAPLEGAQRPGHFRGVTTVVAKLFNAVQPQKAYFGQKDAQQAAVHQPGQGIGRGAGVGKGLEHALLRDVAYETVLLGDRPRLHARAAAWLDRAASDRRREYLQEIADLKANYEIKALELAGGMKLGESDDLLGDEKGPEIEIPEKDREVVVGDEVLDADPAARAVFALSE